MGSTFEVRFFRDLDEVSAMQAEWDEFMESIDGEIFLTYDWCRCWWKYYGHNRKLLVFMFRNEGKLVGILPLFMETLRLGPVSVRVAKMVGSDFVPVTVTVPVLEDFLPQAMQAVVKELFETYRCDLLHVGSICGRYDGMDGLERAINAAVNDRGRVDIKSIDVQTYWKLASSWEEQLSKLSHEQRRNMRRKYERILKEKRVLECLPAENGNLRELFDCFVKAHQEYWQKMGLAGHFGDWPASYEFHREVAIAQLNRDRLRLYEIRLDGVVIGYNYGYKFGETYDYFLFGRTLFDGADKIDFVRIDYGEMVKRAFKENVRWFNAMRGRYEYKLHTGGELYPVRSVFVRGGGVVSGIRVKLFRKMASLTDIVYSKIWRRRLIPRLGLRPGYLWRPWIKTNALRS